MFLQILISFVYFGLICLIIRWIAKQKHRRLKFYEKLSSNIAIIAISLPLYFTQILPFIKDHYSNSEINKGGSATFLQLPQQLKDRWRSLDEPTREESKKIYILTLSKGILIADKTQDQRDKEALSAFKEGNLSQAGSLYGALYEEKEKDIDEAAEYAYQLGSIKRLQLQFKEAEPWFEKAVQFDPDNDDSLFNLGQMNYSLGSNNDALTHFNRCLTLREQKYPKGDVKLINCLNNLGKAYQSSGDKKRAEECFQKAEKIKRQIGK